MKVNEVGTCEDVTALARRVNHIPRERMQHYSHLTADNKKEERRRRWEGERGEGGEGGREKEVGRERGCSTGTGSVIMG